ncbi:jhy protein homolog isoform X3 [Aquila chrysaetos chrysaetos]|uniref:Junctional cadherin complex regulator n=1 Tax=Aquila chrysaetos chrysaetos TaxID=223781 RepID=A0A663EEY7_AQUCH|nr:jhy protein homolog isoform X3 [Aquila chrysaetos chrysaetos]
MNSSDTKYISVSSPPTCNMNKTHVPQNILMQPDFHPANWKRPSVSEGDFASSLHNSQESDSESLVQERQYQLELQQRIRENEELVGLCSDELENDSLEDSLEEMSLKEQEGAEYDTNRYTNGIQKNDGNGRKQQSVDKYFSLRYNPNWKNTKEVAEFCEAEKACQVAGGSSVDFSQDSFYLHSNGSPEEKNQQEAKSQDSFSEFGTELLRRHEPNATVGNEPFRLHTKRKESADGCHFKASPSTYGSAFSLQIQEHRPQRAKKDFVKKNKRTLGLHSEKINSYLQLHSKKQEVLHQEPVTDPKTVDEEPAQSVLPFQIVKMEPEDKWYLKAQQLKLFAGDNSTNGQAHPHQRNISSTFNVNFQELVKDQGSLQDCKRHIYVDKRPSQSSVHSSPTAPCTTSQFTQTTERHHQEITRLTEAHLADKHLFSLLPPIIPQVEGGSEVDPESGEGNQVKISRSNSEGYLMQMEKQNQPKVSKKPCSSKAYINLNVKFGGLGPDYEAIKEKKEKLKQQKEYAKQIKEHNMKSIASVQRLPTKPQVISSVSRQKALEYAKTIPRPKTFTARQSDEEVKEERVLPQTLNGDSLPQIASLETLQNRHEKEKQVVAAFRTLHIL